MKSLKICSIRKQFSYFCEHSIYIYLLTQLHAHKYVYMLLYLKICVLYLKISFTISFCNAAVRQHANNTQTFVRVIANAASRQLVRRDYNISQLMLDRLCCAKFIECVGSSGLIISTIMICSLLLLSMFIIFECKRFSIQLWLFCLR